MAPLIGYALREPGSLDCGDIIDRVPDGSGGVAQYEAWRAAASRELQSRVAAGLVRPWVPIEVAGHDILPLFGGAPASDWFEAVLTLVHGLTRADRRVRIVDPVGTLAGPLDGAFTNFQGRYAFRELSPSGSLDLLEGLQAEVEVIGLLSEAARAQEDRQGRQAAAKAQSVLGLVTTHLRGSQLTIPRLKAAIECALHGSPSRSALLDSAEEAAILSGAFARLSQNHGLWNQVFEVDALLEQMAAFHATSLATRRPGKPGRGQISLLGVGSHMPLTAKELAGDLLAARLVIDQQERPTDALILLGADRIPGRLLDHLADAVSGSGTVFLPFFERLAEGGVSRLGWRGSAVAGFFRLGNHQDAQTAADFMGKQHQFVLSGVSQSRSKGFEWGWSTSIAAGTDVSTSRAWGIGSAFSSTSTRTVSRSRSTTNASSGGRSLSASNTQSYERVYEHLLDPAVFQGLGTGALLLVDVSTRSARLATTARDVTRSKLVDWGHVVEIAEP